VNASQGFPGRECRRPNAREDPVDVSELTFWSIMKWVLVVLVAGFIGQFGKTFATHLLEKIRAGRAAKRREPSTVGALTPRTPMSPPPPAGPALPDGGVRGQAPVAVASPDRPASEDRPFPAPPLDKKALKALAKAQKKALKSKEG